METIIIVGAIVAAALFLIRSYYRSSTGKSSACNCGTCPLTKDCDSVKKPEGGGEGEPDRSDGSD
jgi:FeoB-associated Cys-rich membrane protein